MPDTRARVRIGRVIGHRRRQLVALVLLTALAVQAGLGCAPFGGNRSYWMASGTEPAVSGARLALAPINFRDALPYPLAPRLAIVERELEAYLVARGIQPLRVEKRSFDELWTRATGDVGGLNDIPEQAVRERYDSAMASTIAALRVRSQQAFDALVVATVIYRSAAVSGLDASWDHVVRAFPTSRTPPASVMPAVAAPSQIPALSLHIEVFDAAGARVFEAYGGLELPERLDLSTNVSRPRGDALVDTDHIREALELTLAPFLPPPPTE